MRAATFKIGGIHVPEHKTTPADKIITVELPMSVAVILRQHIGAPAKAIVKKGDIVKRYQKIAEAAAKISAPVHSPISGTVTAIGPVRTFQGQLEEAIFIKADQQQHDEDMQSLQILPQPCDYSSMTPQEIVAKIADSGIVGLGGATFPTAMKLCPPPGSEVKVLIINGSECEPYLTCDDALMRAHAAEIVEGAYIMQKASGAPRVVIGIENNKPEAIEAMSNAAAKFSDISVLPLQTKYPEGGEKQLINAVTGAEVKSGALPISAGAIVQNVATAYAVYRAVVYGIPVVEKVITVAGYGNYLVQVGMNLSDLPIEVSEPKEQADVVIGGPMMGRSAVTLDAPVQKGTSGVTTLEPLPFNPQPCIKCGECATACPMGLQPFLIATFSRFGKVDEALDAGAMDCIECGCCSYSCPSARPILDFIRLAKINIRKRPK